MQNVCVKTLENKTERVNEKRKNRVTYLSNNAYGKNPYSVDNVALRHADKTKIEC